MSEIGIEVVLIDQIIAPLMHIVNSLNQTTSVFQDMQRVSEEPIDVVAFEVVSEQAHDATMALNELHDAFETVNSTALALPNPSAETTALVPYDPTNGQTTELVPYDPTNGQTTAIVPYVPPVTQVPDPSEWQTPNTVDVFTGDGVDRYQKEMASANEMLDLVTQNQQRITAMSNSTQIFPANMIADLQAMDSRIKEIRKSIEQIESNPIDDLGADAVNNDLETLRNQLNQAIHAQTSLTNAMQDMDVSAASQAYNNLNNVIDSTQVHIRDNLNIQNTALDGLKDKVKGAATSFASLENVGKLLNLSDSMVQSDAKLSMIVDDGGSVNELQQKIFDSAQRSKTDYAGTADAVSKLSLGTGNTFSTNDEAIQFAENMNKQFVIAGASQADMSSASSMLTEALGSGALGGEQLNAILGTAPNIVQSIADYMGVPIEKIQEMASNGQITSDILKNSMLGATDEINTNFSNMPTTFAQIANNIKNSALMAFQPILDKVSSIGEFISNNWSVIEPILVGIAAAAGTLAIALGIQAAATWIASGAASAFFATLLTNPLIWIAVVIGLLIGLIYNWVQSVGGIQIAWLIAVNVLLSAIDKLKIGFFIGLYGVMNLFDNLSLAAMRVSGNIQNFIGDMKVGVLLILQSMVNEAIGIINDFISVLNKIEGVSIKPISEVTFATDAQLKNEAERSAREAELQDYENKIGEKIKNREDKVNNMKEDAYAAEQKRQAKIDALQLEARNEKETKEDPATKNNPYTDNTGYTNNTPYTDVGAGTDSQNLANIADNTSGIKDAVNISGEDLKYMRDLAEVEVVNRFTTAEIKIDQTNNNKINSNLDVDGINNKLNNGLRDAIAFATEGVHL